MRVVAIEGGVFAVTPSSLAFNDQMVIRSRRFRCGGVQAGFRDLTIWSFLTASEHRAGLIVLPVVLAGSHAHHMAAARGAISGVPATPIHTLGTLP